MVTTGTSARVSYTVDDDATAISLGSGDVPVLGTPKVVALVEQAAVAAVAGSLGDGETTVGTNVTVDHLAPTSVGATVMAEATTTDVAGRRIEFAVTLREGDRIVARGTHTRAIVDRARFAGT
jgi:predicted thioesterase